jgi:catechol 2,3-dioxygenase-like lactoylglutathione lyase family enzyme
MSGTKDTPFEYRGIHHLALVTSDMQRTVDFYTNVLGMKVVKGFDLAQGYGQHFFFDVGNGNLLAFFWFRDAPRGDRGIVSANALPRSGQSISSAHGSMNHVALLVAADRLEEYRERLIAHGIDVSEIVNHADVEPPPGGERVTLTEDEHTWVRSIYFCDPDGITLELTAELKEPSRTVIEPVDATGRKVGRCRPTVEDSR